MYKFVQKNKTGRVTHVKNLSAFYRIFFTIFFHIWRNFQIIKRSSNLQNGNTVPLIQSTTNLFGKKSLLNNAFMYFQVIRTTSHNAIIQKFERTEDVSTLCASFDEVNKKNKVQKISSRSSFKLISCLRKTYIAFSCNRQLRNQK